MTIARVVKKVSIDQQPSDVLYWRSRSYSVRLAAVEEIRRIELWPFFNAEIRVHERRPPTGVPSTAGWRAVDITSRTVNIEGGDTRALASAAPERVGAIITTLANRFH